MTYFLAALLLLLLLPTPALAQVTPAALPYYGHFDRDGIVDYGIALPQPAPFGHKLDLYVRCSSNGRVLHATMSTGGPGTVQIPVLADLDEDGLADLAVFLPVSRTYYYWRSGAPGWFGSCRQLAAYPNDCTYVNLAHILAVTGGGGGVLTLSERLRDAARAGDGGYVVASVGLLINAADALDALRGLTPYNCDCLPAGPDGRPMEGDAAIYCQRWVILRDDLIAALELDSAVLPKEQGDPMSQGEEGR